MNLKIGIADDGSKYVYDEDQHEKILARGFLLTAGAAEWIREAESEQKNFYTDPDTGAKKEIKQAQLGAIDPKALLLLAEAAGYGAGKYEQYNYLKGYPWSLSFNAMMRHALAFWNGEDLDPESGLPHMVHAAWHGLAMTSFLTRGIGEDDRFKGENT